MCRPDRAKFAKCVDVLGACRRSRAKFEKSLGLARAEFEKSLGLDRAKFAKLLSRLSNLPTPSGPFEADLRPHRNGHGTGNLGHLV